MEPDRGRRPTWGDWLKQPVPVRRGWLAWLILLVLQNFDKDGNLTRHQPNQMHFPLREIPGGMVIDADTETGEMRGDNA